ncbi:hypothetical protein, partial [Jannaschia sp. AI_61]|uniref:hypothetical protein n=1 Tax=Jannaschia sp. AI_61 TaxID=2829796 RepID=UPI001C7CD790
RLSPAARGTVPVVALFLAVAALSASPWAPATWVTGLGLAVLGAGALATMADLRRYLRRKAKAGT